MFPFDAKFNRGLVPCLAGVPYGTERDEGNDTPWKKLESYVMAEVRQSVDGHRHYFPSGSTISSPSYQTVQLALPDAVGKVVDGDLDPQQLTRQLPEQLRSILDTFANARYGKKLAVLSSEEQREVYALLGGAMKEVGSSSSKVAGNAVSAAVDPFPRRSEMRVDSSQSYYPTSFCQSGHSRQASWSILAVAVVTIVVVLAGAFAIWRWLL